MDKLFINTFMDAHHYHEIMRLFVRTSYFFGFVIREKCPSSSKLKSLLKDLEGTIVFCGEVSEWPGTKLYGSQITRYKYKVTDSTYEIIKRYSNSFEDWNYPEMPESIHFLDKSDNSKLETISHESIAYVFCSSSSEVCRYCVQKRLVVDRPVF